MYNYLNNKNVLYVEDDETVLNNISKLLRNYFAKVHTAADGQSGYTVFTNEEIDILLVDIELPKLNGINLIKQIRKIDQKVPIVIISAYTKTDYLLESVELNLNKYIVKPFTSKKFHTLLKNLDDTFKGDGTYELTPDVLVNKDECCVTFGGKQFSLTPKELEFLEILALKGTVNYNEIDEIWQDNPPSQDAIRSFIKTLRKKLPVNLLKNRQNLGYFIERVS
jgi:DNA-binding response OmpR family regulator